MPKGLYLMSDGQVWLSMATVAEFQFRLRNTRQTATSRGATNFRLKFRARRARSLPTLKREGRRRR